MLTLSADSRAESLPEFRTAVHQIKHLSRVEELLELAQELDTLIVPAFGVDENQEGTGTGR